MMVRLAAVTGPRRKVISSFKSGSVGSNYFECKLECGHRAIAYGRATKESPIKTAPLSMICVKCGKASHD